MDTAKQPSIQGARTLALPLHRHRAALPSAQACSAARMDTTSSDRAGRSPGSKEATPERGGQRQFSRAEERKKAFACLESDTKGPGVSSVLDTMLGIGLTAFSHDPLVITLWWPEQPLGHRPRLLTSSREALDLRLRALGEQLPQ